MTLPTPPGPGHYPVTLQTTSFYLLAAVLGLFFLMLWYLWLAYPHRKRGLEGYLDAVGIDITFIALGLGLVVALALYDPMGDLTSYALYRTILSGYWLAFAIPIVTVGSSVQARSRGSIRWFVPAILIDIALFLAIFVFYFLNPG
jgi:hypothetical protein